MKNIEQKLDPIYERMTVILASTLSQVLFLLSFLWYNIFQELTYLAIISEIAITIGLLILRGQNVAGERMERNVHKDLNKSDEVLAKLKR